MSKYIDADLDGGDSFPRIPAKKVPLAMGMPSEAKKHKHSDYSFDSQNGRLEDIHAGSQSVIPGIIPTHNNSSNTIAMDYGGIYSMNSGEVSTKMVKKKLAVRPHHIMAKYVVSS